MCGCITGEIENLKRVLSSHADRLMEQSAYIQTLQTEIVRLKCQVASHSAELSSLKPKDVGCEFDLYESKDNGELEYYASCQSRHAAVMWASERSCYPRSFMHKKR